MDIVEEAIQVLETRLTRGDYVVSNSDSVKDFLRLKYAEAELEIFSVVLMDSHHCVLEHIELFFGTIDKASVYPREIMKVALKLNAAAIILVHNHPSHDPEPSQSDIAITRKIKEILDIRLLDHVIVGLDTISMAERGLI